MKNSFFKLVGTQGSSFYGLFLKVPSFPVFIVTVNILRFSDSQKQAEYTQIIVLQNAGEKQQKGTRCPHFYL